MDAPGTRFGNCEKKKLAKRTTPELVQMKTLRALMSLWMQPAKVEGGGKAMEGDGRQRKAVEGGGRRREVRVCVTARSCVWQCKAM